MTRFEHFLRLLIIAGLVGTGLILATGLTYVVFLMSGFSSTDLLNMDQEGLAELPGSTIRTLLWIQHVFSFILPAFLFGKFIYPGALARGLDIGRLPSGNQVLYAILFIMAAYPLVILSYKLNELIPLPGWATTMENEAAGILEKLLVMDSPLIFLFNLLVIAILPGIGEELIFRGIIQKHLGGLLKNPLAAIWIAAIAFSAFHMQFEGFLPRLVLGALLGYLYYWTKNLWVPIIVHAFNNGIQIIIVYFTKVDIATMDSDSNDQLQMWMLPLSIAAMYFTYRAIIKKTRTIE